MASAMWCRKRIDMCGGVVIYKVMVAKWRHVCNDISIKRDGNGYQCAACHKAFVVASRNVCYYHVAA